MWKTTNYKGETQYWYSEEEYKKLLKYKTQTQELKRIVDWATRQLDLALDASKTDADESLDIIFSLSNRMKQKLELI